MEPGDTGTILIRGAAQLLTLSGPPGARRGAELNELGIIKDGAVLIRDGVVLETNTSRRLENLDGAREALEINASGKVVMPGFVDSHTHLLFPPPGSPEREMVKAVNAIRTSTAKRATAEARNFLDAMARHGTTTVEAKTGAGCDRRAEMKLLRVLEALREEAVEVVPTVLLRIDPGGGAAMREMADWYIGALLPKALQRDAVRFADWACAESPNDMGCLLDYWRSARAAGIGCKVHADQLNPERAIEAAAQNFAITIDHLEQAGAADWSALARSRTMATLMPGWDIDGPAAPARALIEAGVPLALASDFHPRLRPNLNMQSVIALAFRQFGLTAAEAISAATINGAHALQCAARTGSLERGKSADLVILNISDYRDVAHSLGTNLVHLTMKRGEIIYREGEVAKRSSSSE